jgi:hypothetical protein
MKPTRLPIATARVVALSFLLTTALLHADALDNGLVRAEFNGRGLTAIRDLASQQNVGFAQDETAVFVGDDAVESEFLQPVVETTTVTNRVYVLRAGRWTVRVIYELQPGWRFVSKQVAVSGSGEREFRVRRFETLRGRLASAPADELRLRETSFLRFGGQDGTPAHGLFVTLQNPFGQWKRQGKRVSLGYAPDMVWPPGADAFVSDRLCLGPYTPSGVTLPAHMAPEWRFTPAGAADSGPRVDTAEVDAAVACTRAFLRYRPEHATRVMVGWCVNDYQIDVAAPTGRTEYKRIIDQAAAVGARDILFAPANSEVSSLAENRDAWGWENLLWFGMGQKLRKGEWDSAKDKLPVSVQELLGYARARDIRFLAYVYPSLPFMQNPAWTAWVPGGHPSGYLGADTGQRSFQDWLLGNLVAFQKNTGAGGFSFDHWWIAYDDTPNSHYAQWAGCRRILETLRERVPDVVMDGRQQYQYFGAWTWLAGSYPHPLQGDEQPESFPSFPDLHWDRISADRQRRTAWYYRQECFAPVEIIPGYLTHQTPRNDAQGVCRRERFRPADWDLLGWKYSVIAAIASGPFQHVINFLPARDEREFKAFSLADRQWLRDWFDWTDRNLDVLRDARPIIGPPQVGRVDGWAAFKGDHGFVFLFNPNYRPLTAKFALDQTIGLQAGQNFVLRQLYPDAEKGRLLAPSGKTFWQRGDQVSLPVAGAEALVLEVEPAPASVEQPLLLGTVGKATLASDQLQLTGVRGEPGTERELAVALPTTTAIRSLRVNGVATKFQQDGARVSATVRFAGQPFAARQQVGAYDPQFAGGSFSAEATIPARVFRQLAARRQTWPVDYTAAEREAVWLNSDRLLLYINVAEPDDATMRDPILSVDGEIVPVKRAYSSIVRSNPRNTFTGWYADVTALQPDVPHRFAVQLSRLRVGQFQGLFFDTVEADFTDAIVPGNGS